jgi:hypothetical protein
VAAPSKTDSYANSSSEPPKLALTGDVGGHAAELHTELARLGMNAETLVLPTASTVCHVAHGCIADVGRARSTRLQRFVPAADACTVHHTLVFSKPCQAVRLTDRFDISRVAQT